MTSEFGWYLAAATTCQAAFALGYWLLLARLTTFGLNRAYLLAALLLSVALPLLPLPAAWAAWLGPAPAASAALPAWGLGPAAPVAGGSAAVAPAGSWQWPLLLAAYWLGVAWQVARTGRSLGSLYRLGRRHPRTRQGGSWVVQLVEPGWPAFSFGRYVFLGPDYARLSPAEQRQVLAHEQAHGRQYHSLDVLLVEVLNWFFWFNGLVRYLGRQLRTTHEYLADAAVAHEAGSRHAYGHLLLKLAAAPRQPRHLAHPFATRQVALRIRMLASLPSSPLQRLRLLLVLPLAAAAWAGAALLGPRPVAATVLPAADAPAQRRIGTITWQGNTFLTTAQLNEALGLRPGDAYVQQVLEARLNRTDDGAISSRYLNQGYLFFQLAPPRVQLQPDGTANLILVLHEGRQARLGTLSVTGTKQASAADILARLPLRSGDLFSRAKLMEAQRVLAQDGRFDPGQVNINPQPVPQPGEATDLVDVTFAVTER